MIGFLTANHHVQNWKDYSCKINFVCIYPGVGIKSQPKSSIINPLPGKKKKKLVSASRVSLVFRAPFYYFPQHAGAARFLTSVLILSVAGLFAGSVTTIVYPPSFPPSLLSSFLSYFLFLFLQYGGK